LALHGKGICVVDKLMKKNWDTRLNKLKNTIEYWCNNNTNKTVEIINLFYDSKIEKEENENISK